MSRRATLIGGVIALLVAVGLGWLAWSLTHPDAQATAGAGAGARPGGVPGGRPGGGRGAATTVGVATAERADIPVVIEALGTVVPQATVRVRPQVSGVLQSIAFQEGQMVKKGQLLATIDPRPFEAALQSAIGNRQRNEAQLQAARVTLERYETLLKQDSIARQDVDTQAAQARQFEAQLVTDRASETTARLNLAYTRIVAPISGRVGLRPVDVGNVVGPSDANGIGVITQLTPIDVEFAVPQDHASWLQHNGGASMEAKAFDRTKVTLLDVGAFASLDNQIDAQTGTVKAKARFNNARMQLFPSQFVNVQLQLRTIRDAVVVPVSALRQGANGEYVFVLNADRTVQLRPVVRGQAVGDRMQVASGLQIGERVITEGADRLRDGSRVVLPGDAPGGFGGQGGRRQRSGASGPQGAASGFTPPGAVSDASAARAVPSGNPQAGAMPGGQPGGARQQGVPAAGPGPTPPWAGASAMTGAPRGDLTPEEREARRKRLEAMSPEEREARRKRFEAMSPEERAALRDRFRQQGGAGGGGMGGAGGAGGGGTQ